MLVPDHLALHDYLMKRGVTDRTAQRAVETLTTFIQLDTRHGYPLKPPTALSVSSFGSAMWTAFKIPVSRCWFFHAAMQTDENPCAGDVTRLDDLTVAAYGDSCDRGILMDTNFERAYERTCGGRLVAALEATMAQPRKFCPSDMLNAVLRMRVALIASGAADRAKQLAPLAELLPHVIPVAGTDRKRGEWCLVVR